MNGERFGFILEYSPKHFECMVIEVIKEASFDYAILWAADIDNYIDAHGWLSDSPFKMSKCFKPLKKDDTQLPTLEELADHGIFAVV